jgi:hypothetical protein
MNILSLSLVSFYPGRITIRCLDKLISIIIPMDDDISLLITL